MLRGQFEKLEVGDIVLVGGNSKYRGHSATVMKVDNKRVFGRTAFLFFPATKETKVYHYQFLTKIMTTGQSPEDE